MNFFLTRNFCFFTLIFLVFFQLVSCDQDLVIAKNNITPEDDAKIGATMDQALLNYIDTVPGITLVDQQTYPAIYSYINQISQFINGSNSFLTLGTDLQGNPFNDSYTPTIRVIDQAGNSGAFVLPGGYIYLHKDLLKSIDFEAQFAPILAHLIACSKNRYDIEKLEKRFSTNFLLALALGGTINNNSETNIATVLDALNNEPYPTDIVDLLDKEAEKAACELGYDIQTYADWFIQQSNGNVKWCRQFPRSLSLEDYASHLFYAVRDSLSCGGEVDEGDYPQFKSLLN